MQVSILILFHPQNINIQRMDPMILNLLSGFNLEDSVIERFAQSHILYTQLSALDHDDLISMGVSDADTQEEMLAAFGNLEGQDVHLAT